MTFLKKENKSNQLDKIQLNNIMIQDNNNFYSIINETNDNYRINDKYSKKDSNQFSIIKNNVKNNNFLNFKRKPKSNKKKIKLKNNNHKIRIDLDDENNNENENENNNTNNIEMLNDKLIEIIKSDIFDYDTNFEIDFKKNLKKYFWKNLIFKKCGGQNKLLFEIIKDIEKYENKKNKKIKKENILNIQNYEKEKENEFLNDNSTISQSKRNKKINRNNIIVIHIDDDEEEENEDIKEENNKEENNKEENNDNYDINLSDIYNFSELSEKENLLLEIENTKELENESKFLKEFLYNGNYFEENNILFPENFAYDEITEDIMEEENILRQSISLKLYAMLKLVYPSLDKYIFQKNITYLEHLANKIDTIIGNKYLLIIDMIFSRIKEEALKIKQRKNQEKNSINIY